MDWQMLHGIDDYSHALDMPRVVMAQVLSYWPYMMECLWKLLTPARIVKQLARCCIERLSCKRIAQGLRDVDQSFTVFYSPCKKPLLWLRVLRTAQPASHFSSTRFCRYPAKALSWKQPCRQPLASIGTTCSHDPGRLQMFAPSECATIQREPSNLSGMTLTNSPKERLLNTEQNHKD